MEQAIQLIGAPTDKEVVQNQQKSSVESLIDDIGLTCGTCTLINKEGDKFCDACGATLGMVYSPIRPAKRNSLDFPPLMRRAERRLGQSHAHSRHGLSLWRPGQSRPVGVDRGRGRYSRLQCSSETTTSDQSLSEAPLLSPHCEEAELSLCPRIAYFNADIPNHINQVEAAQFHNGMSMYNGGFPPPLPVGHAMGANVFGMNGVEGNNCMHVPTGRLVELETQSPRGRGVRRRLARLRDRGKWMDNCDFAMDDP